MDLEPFNEQSDIDVAVISNHRFTIAWRYLRLNGARRLKLDQRTRNAWDEQVKKYINWGTIAPDNLLGIFPFALDWMKATTGMGMEDPIKGRDVNEWDENRNATHDERAIVNRVTVPATWRVLELKVNLRGSFQSVLHGGHPARQKKLKTLRKTD